MSFSISDVVNVAEKSSRGRASVLYLTKGAPAAEAPITSSSAARETPDASPSTSASEIELREPADHQVDRELDDPRLLAVADVTDRRADRAEHGLDALERLAAGRRR